MRVRITYLRTDYLKGLIFVICDPFFVMELSSVELRYLVSEIKCRIVSSSSSEYYVSSINAITKSSLLIRLHHPIHEDVMLVVSTKGIWITRLKFKPMEENNNLESIAQKELERAKLELIEQVGSERIVSLKFRQLDGKVRILIGEFFGNGNIVICDENMQIIAILTPIEVRHRTLTVGLRYAYPPTKGVDVFNITLDQMLSLRNEAKNLDVLRWIGRSISMPKKFVEEVTKRAGIQLSVQAANLSDDEVSKIYQVIKSFVDGVGTGKNHEPIVIMQNGKPQEALPIITQEAAVAAGTENLKKNVKKHASYMDAVDEVLSNEILDMGRSSRTIELDREIAVLEHDLEEQNKAKETVLQKATTIRKLARELMALSYQSTDNIDNVLAANSASIVTEKGIKYMKVAGEQVEMHPSLAKVSSLLFERAKEMERGNVSIEESRSRILAQIGKLRNETAAIHKRIVIKEQISREWYERYRWFITTDGLLAIGGRDASSNSALIRKHLTEQDIIFHAEVHGSPFFIIKNAAAFRAGESAASKIDSSLQEVAQATVSFSRAWRDGLSSADAYWVMPEQVKKGAPTGQFLPKGSFVIEGKRNYLKGVEIRLAIGIVQLNDRETLVCGPEAAIRKHSILYAALLQGGMDPMNAAKKIKSEFVKIVANNIKISESIKHMSLDDFVRALPTGQTRLSFIAKGQQQQQVQPIVMEAGDK